MRRLAIHTEKLAAALRQKRNYILANTDWTQLADSPLDDKTKEEYRAFRQALRDITEQEGFPLSVQFPSLILGV